MEAEERKRLFEAFLPLAKKRAKRFRWSGHSLAELTSVACLGLWLAILKFDPATFKNGLAAYAIPWIDGELKEFVTEGQSLVMSRDGSRNERGKFLPRASHVGHFGNVAIGDGEVRRDTSLYAEIGETGTGDDEELGGCYWLDTFADHKLEAIRGDHYRERLKSYRRGIDLKISWRAGRWKWIGHAWLDFAAKRFYAERLEFYKRGVGYFFRSRRMEKCHREILPYKPPAWTRKPQPETRFGPAAYYATFDARLYGYLRIVTGIGPKTEDGGQDDWQDWKGKRKRNPPPRWRLNARGYPSAYRKPYEPRPIKARVPEFWSDDDLSDYEIWSVSSYSRVLHESYLRPYRVPWLTAKHRVLNKWSKPVGTVEHSPYLMGESDYGHKDIGFCLEGWAFLGDCHKHRGSLVLHKLRKHPLHLKADSPLVLLFWARQLIAWHYIRHWLPLEKEHETETEDKRRQARHKAA